MNTAVIAQSVKSVLSPALRGIAVHTPTETGERKTPYVLVACEAVEERIKGNNTWECELRASLRAHAHDWRQEQFDTSFAALIQALGGRRVADLLCEQSRGFIVYSFRLKSIEEVQVDDEDYVQEATYKLFVQF